MKTEGHNHAFAVHGIDGKRIAMVSSGVKRERVLKPLPSFVYSNLIFVEDRTFHRHLGVSIRGISRAIILSIRARKIVQGGSTITQQLFRTLVPINNRYLRKFAEICFSPFLTAVLGRQRILDLYLSNVYFGKNIFGISAAAKIFFKKNSLDLNRLESLVLVSLLTRPNYWLKNPQRLSKKVSQLSSAIGMTDFCGSKIHILTKRLAKNAATVNETPTWFPKFNEYMIRFATSKDRIQIMIHPKLQMKILSSISRQRQNVLVAIMDCKTKQLKAIVDCIGQPDSVFPTLFSNRIELGSLLKPILIMLAVRKGVDPSKLYFQSRPTEIHFDGYPSWRVSNYGDLYSGNLSLEDAIATSDNSVCVQALRYLGFREFVMLLVEHDIINAADINKITPAIVLGASTAPVNTIALMKLYSEFASMRNRSPELLIKNFTSAIAPSRFAEVVAVRKALKKTVSFGTARSLRYTGVLGAKTGSSGPYESILFYDRENLYLIIHKEKVDYILHEQWASQFDKSYRVTDFAKSLLKDLHIFLKSIINPNELYGKFRRSA